jgi:hypothetical protein
MKKFLLLGLVALPLVLFMARSASACPACQEAVVNASGKDDDDPMREARAYNNSIYLMVAVPYTVLGAIGTFVYRGYKTALRKAQDAQLNGSQHSTLQPS